MYGVTEGIPLTGDTLALCFDLIFVLLKVRGGGSGMAELDVVGHICDVTTCDVTLTCGGDWV